MSEPEDTAVRVMGAVLPLVKAASDAAFALECVAHLQGREKDLLPYAEALRKAVREMKQAVNPADGDGTLQVKTTELPDERLEL